MLWEGANNMETERLSQEGRLQISSKALEKIAWYAAKEITGVADIGSFNAGGYDLKKFFVSQNAITVEVKNGVVDVQLSLILDEKAVLVDVCEKVQNNVKNAIQNMSAVTVGRVNITVGGLAQSNEE